jgi:hypothetical protein
MTAIALWFTAGAILGIVAGVWGALWLVVTLGNDDEFLRGYDD